MRHIKFIFLFFIFLTLVACSPVKLPPTNSFTLNPGPAHFQKAYRSSKTLLVMDTVSNDELDTKKMAYVIKPYQLAYFSKNNWIATPPDQISALITRALQQSHYFKAVVATPFVGVTDLKLTTYLFKLQQNFLFNPSREQLVLAAQLLNARNGRIIAEKTFSYDVATMSNTPEGGAAAANIIMQRLQRDLVGFVVRHS